MNNVILIGRLTKDAEVKVINEKGTKVCNFSIAVSRGYKNEKGEYETDFFNCVAWDKLGENIAEFVKKGDQVAISGRIQNRSYETETGLVRNVSEIVCSGVTFLNKKQQEA